MRRQLPVDTLMPAWCQTVGVVISPLYHCYPFTCVEAHNGDIKKGEYNMNVLSQRISLLDFPLWSVTVHEYYLFNISSDLDVCHSEGKGIFLCLFISLAIPFNLVISRMNSISLSSLTSLSNDCRIESISTASFSLSCRRFCWADTSDKTWDVVSLNDERVALESFCPVRLMSAMMSSFC